MHHGVNINLNNSNFYQAMGVTMVGIHERTGRAKIFSS